MDFSICLPNTSILHLDDISVEEKTVVFKVSSTQLQAVCPDCHQISNKVHSRYRRTLADLPLSGLAVQLLCQVKKFFCRNSECFRRVFVERLQDVARISARQTNRLIQIIYSLAFYVGGRVFWRGTSFFRRKTSRYKTSSNSHGYYAKGDFYFHWFSKPNNFIHLYKEIF